MKSRQNSDMFIQTNICPLRYQDASEFQDISVRKIQIDEKSEE